VIFDLLDRDGRVQLATVVTASVGGPERGTWVATVNLEPGTAAVLIHQEEMEEGAASAHERAAVVPV
jgi:hypothetical protein